MICYFEWLNEETEMYWELIVQIEGNVKTDLSFRKSVFIVLAISLKRQRKKKEFLVSFTSYVRQGLMHACHRERVEVGGQTAGVGLSSSVRVPGMGCRLSVLVTFAWWAISLMIPFFPLSLFIILNIRQEFSAPFPPVSAADILAFQARAQLLESL